MTVRYLLYSILNSLFNWITHSSFLFHVAVKIDCSIIILARTFIKLFISIILNWRYIQILLGLLSRKHFTFEWQAPDYKFPSYWILITGSIWLLNEALRGSLEMQIPAPSWTLCDLVHCLKLADWPPNYFKKWVFLGSRRAEKPQDELWFLFPSHLAPFLWFN